MRRFLLIFCCIPMFSGAADWSTPSEESNYRTTPNYEETMAYIRRIAEAAPDRVKLEAFGSSGQGRTLWTVIVGRDGVFTPQAARNANRAIVLIQNGIHAGEIDGKDASLALLRDIVITKTHAALLDRAVILIVPVYNVDGHERISRHNRINQNGPEEMGWRTTAVNLNLNRDYIKADCPETRAFLKLWKRWLPDFFFDNHVTDGADYQYDITYGVDHGPDVYPDLARWLEASVFPYVEQSVGKTGHMIGPFVNFVDEHDPTKGLTIGQSPPRFSTGFTILQNRPGMLVEMHMLKDYKTRVTGNYELLRATLEVINRDAETLLRINRAADAATEKDGRTGGTIALNVDPTGETKPFLFDGIGFEISESDISGGKRIEYTGEPLTQTIPMQSKLKITRSVKMPAAYIIPVEWIQLIDVIEAHGLIVQRTKEAFTTEVELYSCFLPEWNPKPFEGRHTASFDGTPMGDAGFTIPAVRKEACFLETHNITYAAGSVIVPMTQRAAKVAVHFLEPQGPDSAVAWGFVDSIFEQKEYGENYVLEKLARKMLQSDPNLKREFERRLAADPDFAASRSARLNFFFNRSPYRDHRIGLYPVGRLKHIPK
ncbi:MAG TPA: M14 family metallopeptidase [Acidobacteriota bacterium]|nr:M14 family metallopeptidase [Acidobacteriota bacterium]